MGFDDDYLDRLIDRNSPEPIYLQVSKILESIIKENYNPNTRLPSEEYFTEKFKVSRPTINSAISCLIQKRILRKDKGKGTYIEDPKKFQLIEFNEIETIMQYKGHRIKNLILEFGKIKNNGFVCEALNIPSNKQAVILKRVRYVDNIPFYISTCYFPEKLYSYLKEIDFSKEFLYKSLGERFNIHIVKVERLIKVVKSELEEVRYLNLSKDDPILEIKGTSYDESNKAIFCHVTKFDAERVCVRGTVWAVSPDAGKKV